MLAGIAGSNRAKGIDACLVNLVCCQVEVSATFRSLLQRSPTQCVVSECDHEALTMKRRWTTRGCTAMETVKTFAVQGASFPREA